MDNFLTALYFEYFESIEEEKRLRNIHEFSSDNANIRNDQKIADAREHSKKINELIKTYLAHLGL